MELDLLPCAGCKQAKVLKLGDYCIVCAVDWPVVPEYIVVVPKTLDKAAEISGITREYLSGKSDKAFEAFQSYVIYPDGNEWKEIVISDKLHLPTVMKNLLNKGH